MSSEVTVGEEFGLRDAPIPMDRVYNFGMCGGDSFSISSSGNSLLFFASLSENIYADTVRVNSFAIS